MTLMLFLDIAMLVLIVSMFKTGSRALKLHQGVAAGEVDPSYVIGPHRNGLMMILCMSTLLLLSLGLILFMRPFLPDVALSMSETNWIPWLALGFGACVVLLSSLFLIEAYSPASDTSLPVKVLMAVGLLAGSYFVASALNHFWFYRDHKVNFSGNVSYLEIEGFPCEGWVIGRMEGDVARYRCPDDFRLLLGGPYGSAPFVPLLSYTEGTSKELKDKIEVTFANAERGGESQSKPEAP